MPERLISVLVPVYNREYLIEPCVESILAQSYPHFEIIIVDNASTDGTWAVCQKLAKRDPRVRIFKNSHNIGPVLNWKRCMEEARGNFGKVVFSDDLIAPDCLRQLLAPLQDNDEVGFSFSSVEVGAEAGSGAPMYRWNDVSAVVPSDTFIRDALLFRERIPVSPGAALFRLEDLRKSLVEDIPSPTISDFLSHGAGPDVLLFLLTAQCYPSVAFVREPLCFFRSHRDSITVRGAGGYISSRYLQAKIWFAAQYRPASVLAAVLAEAWLLECKRRKKLVSPREAAALYLPQAVQPGAITILRHGLGAAARFALESIERRGLRLVKN